MSLNWFEKLSRDLVDRGLLIEAGWRALREVAISPAASETQLDEMRNAFFAGAQHLFSSIMGLLEDGTEPTEKDLARMSQIGDELDSFIADYKTKHHLHEH
jgi:hypothetical protein